MASTTPIKERQALSAGDKSPASQQYTRYTISNSERPASSPSVASKNTPTPIPNAVSNYKNINLEENSSQSYNDSKYDLSEEKESESFEYVMTDKSSRDFEFISSFKGKKRRERNKHLRETKREIEKKFQERDNFRELLEDAKEQVRVAKMDEIHIRRQYGQALDSMMNQKDGSNFGFKDHSQQLKEKWTHAKNRLANMTKELDKMKEQFYDIEYQCFKNENLLQEINQQLETEEETEEALRNLQKQKQEQTFEKKIKSEKQTEKKKQKQKDEQKIIQYQQTQDAKKGKLFGRSYLRQSLAPIKEEQQKIEKKKQLQRQKKEEARNQLERNIDRSFNKIRSDNAVRRNRKKQEIREVAERKQELIEEGENPYFIIRANETKQQIEKGIQQKLNRQNKHVSLVSKELDREENRYSKEQEKEMKNRYYEQKFQEEKSRKAMDVKAAKYISSLSADGRDIIDPTRKQHQLFPSKIIRSEKKRQLDPKIFEALSQTDSENAGKDYDENSTFENSSDKLTEWLSSEGSSEFHSQMEDEVDENESSEDEDELPKDKTAKLSDGRFKLRKLSKMEKDHIEKARKRQRENLTEKQIAAGREFKGDAFIPSPSEITFKDFEVGQKYVKTISLTNVSYSFNTFKVLDLDEDIKSYFEVAYNPPGKMSAGTCCKLKIIFKPKLEEDIIRNLSILSQTGKIDIPLKCYTKKILLRYTPNEQLKLGSVVLAESITKKINIINDGALKTRFQLDSKSLHSKFETGSPFSLEPLSGSVKGYSSRTIHVSFSPTQIGEYNTNLNIHFMDGETKSKSIEFLAKGIDVPIYLDRNEIDLGISSVDQEHRRKIKIHNRSNISMKCIVEPPKSLSPWIEFIPILGFVQPEYPFEVSLKFLPTKEIFTQCPHKYFDKETSKFKANFKLKIPDQKLPVTLTISTTITRTSITFEPNQINFGPSSIDEISQFPVNIRNQSILAQNMSFRNISSELWMEPQINSLKAQETQQVNIKFKPKATVNYKQRILCVTDKREEYPLIVRALGIRPPLQISEFISKLRPIAIGDRAFHRFSLYNRSKSIQKYSIQIGDDESVSKTGISISPVEGEISPKTREYLDIEFQVTKEIIHAFMKSKETRQIENDDDENDTDENIEDHDLHSNGENFLNELNNWGTNISTNNSSEENTSNSQKGYLYRRKIPITCYISGFEYEYITFWVSATIKLPTVYVHQDGTIVTNIDFGNSAISHRIKKTLIMVNTSKEDSAHLKVNALKDNKEFWVSHIPPSLPPESSEAIEIFFRPQTSQEYSCYLTIESEFNNMSIYLHGNGIQSNFDIEPNEPWQDLGDTVSGSKITKEFSLKNTSEFSLPFSIEFEDTYPLNLSHSLPFTVSPCEGVIEKDEKETIQVEFNPDHPFPKYSTILNAVSGEKTMGVRIVGRCWNAGPFVLFEDPDDMEGTPISQDTRYHMGFIEDRTEFEHTFQYCDFDENYQFKFYLGLTKSNDEKKTEFAFDKLPEKTGFTLEPLKGSIEPGERKLITVNYTPVKDKLMIHGIDSWDELNIKCTFKLKEPQEIEFKFNGHVHLSQNQNETIQ
eukprot:gb/GECH01008834.1/.p1 GENE.gb/GECH01008834.1/~~gb/GECH01008834.1/.p1  ORF type:complete len:1566 (+),score=405.19 gb/GECH01008834.1/:1-4698(+)